MERAPRRPLAGIEADPAPCAYPAGDLPSGHARWLEPLGPCLIAVSGEWLSFSGGGACTGIVATEGSRSPGCRRCRWISIVEAPASTPRSVSSLRRATISSSSSSDVRCGLDRADVSAARAQPHRMHRTGGTARRLKSRSTRSAGRGALASGTLVRRRLPRRTPCSPSSRIQAFHGAASDVELTSETPRSRTSRGYRLDEGRVSCMAPSFPRGLEPPQDRCGSD